MTSFIRVNITASRTASYLWEQTVTWQRAHSWAKRGCEAPSRWRTFGSGPGMTHPDDPGPGSKSWWTAPQETQSLLQRFSHQVMQLNCGRSENTMISTAAQESRTASHNNKYEPMFTKHRTSPLPVHHLYGSFQLTHSLYSLHTRRFKVCLSQKSESRLFCSFLWFGALFAQLACLHQLTVQ